MGEASGAGVPLSYTGEAMRYLIVLLALAGLVDSGLALRIHYQDPASAPPCAVSAHWDCGAVNHSRFADFPPDAAAGFGDAPAKGGIHLPVAILGLVGYGLIAALALADQLWATLQCAEIGFAFAAFLSYMEEYILEKWCIYCVVSQALITAILLCTAVALALQRRARKRAEKQLSSTSRSGVTVA